LSQEAKGRAHGAIGPQTKHSILVIYWNLYKFGEWYVIERRLSYVVNSTRKTIAGFPVPVIAEVAHALNLARKGDKADFAKPLRGFHGARVLEVVSDADGNTYRVIYTTIDQDAIWVLHAFQKKSKSGIATPQKEIDLVRQRLKQIGPSLEPG